MRAYHDVHNVWETRAGRRRARRSTALRALDVRLVVVSNANGTLHRCSSAWISRRWFDVVLDSHEFGVEKPDPRLFHLALAESGAAAATTVHVGDFFHIDVAGARAAGLADAVLLDLAGLYADAGCTAGARLRRGRDFVAASNCRLQTAAVT